MTLAADMQRISAVALLSTLLVIGAVGPSAAQQADQGDHVDIRLFLAATAQDATLAEEGLRQIGERWRVGYSAIIWDLLRSVRPPSPQFFRFFILLQFLEEQTGQRFGQDLARWHEWIWAQPYKPHPDYALSRGCGTAGSIPASRNFSRAASRPSFASTRSSGAASRSTGFRRSNTRRTSMPLWPTTSKTITLCSASR